MERVTVIIPSKNRPEFLRRSILFWSKHLFPVIVADGSDEPQSECFIDQYTDHIKYIHSKSPLPKRLEIAASLVDTEYCILLSDDEFYLPKALLECVVFLDNNHEYIAAGGVAVGFRPGSTGLLGFEKYSNWLGRERIEPSPRDRVIAHMASYANYLSVSVTRSDIWKSIARLYASREIPIFALWELEMNLILSYGGKSKVLNNLMLFRSYGEGVPIRNNIPSLSTKNALCDVWQSDNQLELKKAFLSIVSDAFDEFSHLEPNPGSTKLVVEDAINAYCQCQNSKPQTKNLPFSFIKECIPDPILKLLRISRMFMTRSIRDHSSLLEAIRRLELTGVFVDHEGARAVLTSLNDFYGYR